MSGKIVLSLLIIGASFLGFSCRSKTIVKKLANQNANISSKSQTKKIDGVMYYLPKTVVQITVPIQKVTKTPGDFAKFAPCFFLESERKGMVTEENKGDSFAINPPNFSSRGVPDTSETYVIETKGKYFESKTLFVEYAPGYVLQKGEAESKNETLEFTVKAVAAAASIAAKAAPIALEANDGEKTKLLEALRTEYQCLRNLGDAGLKGFSASAEEVTNEINKILNPPAAQSASKTAVKSAPLSMPNIINYLQEDKNRNNYQKALALFNELKSLERQRGNILSGNITSPNIPPETYKMMLEKNAEAIESYRAAFLGSKSKDVWAAAFEFTPKTDGEYSPLLFTYSEKKGVCRNGLIKDKSIPIKSGFEFVSKEENCGKTPEVKMKALWLQVKKNPDQNFLDNVRNAAKVSEKQDKSRGWFYRVPADSVVTFQESEFPCLPNGADASKNNCSLDSFAITTGTISGISQKVIKLKYGGIIVEKDIAFNDKQLALGEMQIAQLGVVASVPASTAGRSSTTAIVLDPATGAMKNYKSSSTALIDKSILDDAQKAANSAIDAVDPLNKKKRELEELKTQNQINEEKKKLTNTDATTANDDNPR